MSVYIGIPKVISFHAFVLAAWVAAFVPALRRSRRRGQPNSARLSLTFVVLGIARASLLLPLAFGQDTLPAIFTSLASALDIACGAIVLWPFLSPLLPTTWADSIAGIALCSSVVVVGVQVWQLVRSGGATAAPHLPAWTWLVWASVLLLTLPTLRPPAGQRYRRRLAALATLALGAAGYTSLPAVFVLLLAFTLYEMDRSGTMRTLPAIAPSFQEHENKSPHQAGETTPTISMEAGPDPPALPADAPKYHREFDLLLQASVALAATSVSPNRLNATVAAMNHALQGPEPKAVQGQQLGIFLLQGDRGRRLRLVARHTLAQADLPNPTPASDEFAPPLLLKQCPQLADILRRARVARVGALWELKHPLQSAAYAPLLAQLGASQAGDTLIRPLHYGGRNLGLLVAHRPNGTPPFTSHQKRIIRGLAAQLGAANAHAQILEQYQQAASQRKSILESIADGVIVSDAADRVILINDAALTILDAQRDEVINQPFGQILGRMVPLARSDRHNLVGSITADSSHDTSHGGIQAVFDIGGRVIQSSMAPVHTKQGTPLGLVAVLRNITELEQTQTELERLYTEQLDTTKRLRELDKLKSQFIANMSHELRTPLNSIIGFAGVMLKGIDGPLTDMQSQDLELIRQSSKHLLNTINDILDISQSWANNLTLNLKPTNLSECINTAVRSAQALIGPKPIELVQEIAPNLPEIQADPTRVQQILLNLLNNAIKFTFEGRVSVSARSNGKHVHVSVQDTGIGIAPQHHEMIFKEFSQVDGSSSRQAEGLGLGLAITRQMVELHGGQIWVESQPGAGSTFSFNLPIAGPGVEEKQ